MTVIAWDDLVRGVVSFPRGTAMTIGVFDGVHCGHKVLLSRVSGKAPDLVPVAVTFFQNPKAITRPAFFDGDILSLDQKIDEIAAAGMEFLVLIDFSGDFCRMAGKEFIDLLIDRGRLRYLAVGSDFRCGYRLDTDAFALSKMTGACGIQTEILDHLVVGSSPVSSSRIRAAICSGDLVEAKELLGRNFVLDLSGVPTTPGEGWIGYDVPAAHRIVPPTGRYPVRLFSRHCYGTELAVDIVDGIIRIPTRFDTGRLEFITTVARSEMICQ